MSYILFYSNYCKHSKKFIYFLEQSGMSYNFNKICVDRDNSGRRPKIIKNYNITRVPSIIVNGELLMDRHVFIWLDKKCNSIESVPRPNEPMPTRMNKMENHVPPKQETILQAFEEGGLGNITDTCLSVGNQHNDNFIEYPEDNGELITDRHDSNFVMQNDNLNLVDADTFKDNTTNTNTRTKALAQKDSLKQKQFNSSYEKLLAERSATDPQNNRRV